MATTCSCASPVEIDATGARTCAACALTIADERPRVTGGQGAAPVVWGLPWSCPDCRAWGYVGVCVEEGRRTSDELVEKWIGQKHRELGGCVRAADRILLGRLRRREKPSAEHPDGRMIFMLRKGETEHTPIDPVWPQWDQA